MSRQGTGKQLKGALINLSAYYFGAVPLALLLAFPGYKGVEGLYAGLCIGPAIQVSYNASEYGAKFAIWLLIVPSDGFSAPAGCCLRSASCETQFQVRRMSCFSCREYLVVMRAMTRHVP
jgi:hypothetical protein